MNIGKTVTIILVVVAALGLIIFLIWKNNQDKKKLHPDADNAVEETKMDQFHDKDSI